MPKDTVISNAEWEKRRSDVRVSNDDLNALVMNYLVTEGYYDAASTFQAESGTAPSTNLDTCTDRMHIRNAVEAGKIEDAIERVNDLNPEILEEDAPLFFHLQQQQLIELIREGRVAEALTFAREYLACKGEDNPAFLDELETTIALIAFHDPASCPVGNLMDVAQRQKTAGLLNRSILAKLDQEQEPLLPALMKMLLWGQEKLDAHAKYPKMTDFATGELKGVE